MTKRITGTVTGALIQGFGTDVTDETPCEAVR
jgi:hypothetical protein